MAFLTRLILGKGLHDLKLISRPAVAYFSVSSTVKLSEPRSSSSSSPLKTLEKKKPLQREGFTCVYQFRYIVPLRLLNRFKIYQTVFSCLTGIGSLAAYATQTLTDLQFVAVLNGSMWLALMMLLLISRNSVRVVGAVYLDDATKSKAMISHLDFLAKRRDFVIDLDKVQPFDSVEELKELYLKLRLTDMDGHMYFFHRHGNVLDREGLRKFLKLE